jgi:solute:Na+ symporter, SSS family
MAATIVFIIIITASLRIAFAARHGHHTANLREFFIASRQFGSFLVFFLSVGEIYSIGTIIAFPGSVYAKGGTYGIWFLGSILLAYPVAYFVNPLIWRAGKIYDAVTMPDLFKGHFGSRVLELTVTIAAITFLIPWGQLQFGGLITALNGLGWHISPTVITFLAAGLAFAYVAMAGIRAPAYIAIVKDVLMILAIVVTGVAAASSMGLSNIFHAATPVVSNTLTAPQLRFSMSTIAFQALGFFMLPFNTQNLFTARSEQTIRRTQIFMPLYMFMFPFLVIVADYQIGQHTHLDVANDAFMAAAVELLPGWVLGLVAAAASLSGLLLLAGISLAIGPPVSRNLIGHLPERQQRNWGQVVIAGYLMISIFLTLVAPTLLTTVINTVFFGITQFLPGIMAIMFVRKVNPIAIAVGIIAADVLSILFYLMKTPLFDLNIGLVCLFINIAIIIVGSLIAAPAKAFIPVARRGARIQVAAAE